jgi:hypothetical protein
MQELSLKTKKQIVLSQVIYEYIVSGIEESLASLSQEDMQVFVMRVNMQAITLAIELSLEDEIRDVEFKFDDLGISFTTPVPLSQLEFTTSFMDERVESMKAELGDDFEAMVTYLQKMETPLV